MSRASSPLRDRLIFNVGARRSGTFWLQRVVTAHPEVSAVPSETHLFSHGIAPLFERFQHAARSSPQVGAVYVEREPALDAARDLCDTVFAPYLEEGARYVAERTPLHVLHLRLIAEVYPDCRVVHIVRDGRDVARSIAAQDWGPGSIAAAAQEWRRSVEAARAAGLDGDRYREVLYEDLLATPEPTVVGLYEWLGLDTASAAVAEALAEERRRLNVDRSRHGVAAGKWEEEFTRADFDAFRSAAGELLDSLGYPPGTPRGRPRAAEPPAAGGVRRLARRLTRAARGRAAGAGAGTAPEAAQRRQSERAHAQTVADGAVEALLARRVGDLETLLSPDATIRIVTGDGAREARGEAGRELLADAVAADDALGGSQVLGDTHGSLPTIGYVLALEHDGRRSERLVFVTVHGRLVSELCLYRLPLAPPD